jgi:hypothetical protein
MSGVDTSGEPLFRTAITPEFRSRPHGRNPRWPRRSRRPEDVLPRKRRLEALLQELDAP